jgi:hypothetical protein
VLKYCGAAGATAGAGVGGGVVVVAAAVGVAAAAAGVIVVLVDAVAVLQVLLHCIGIALVSTYLSLWLKAYGAVELIELWTVGLQSCRAVTIKL